MSRKIRVGILFGGRSAEHEISLQSAKNVVSALNPEKYEAVLLGIDKQGKWYLNDYSPKELEGKNYIPLTNDPNLQTCLVPEETHTNIMNLKSLSPTTRVDVIFPVLHGTNGEDGTIQGLLKLANVPFVGSDVLGSAICMDKDIAKRLLQQAELPTAKFETVRTPQLSEIDLDKIIAKLGLPCFVKPANLGSSVGISKVKEKEQLMPALLHAALYDHKIIIEEFIPGREIECAVLGNDDPITSTCAEIVLHHEFYSYEAKYLDEHGASLIVPAKLPPDIMQQIQAYSIKAFQALNCNDIVKG